MEQAMQVIDQLRFAWGLLLAEWIFFYKAVPKKKNFFPRVLLAVAGCSALSLLQLPLRSAVLYTALPTPVMFLILGAAGFLTNLFTLAGAKFCFRTTHGRTFCPGACWGLAWNEWQPLFCAAGS